MSDFTPTQRKPRLIAVVAASPSGVIGRDGDMPWRLSSDLRRFKRLTLGAPIVMGRKTFASIGRPLPGRRNLVLTRGLAAPPPGIEFLPDIDALLSATATAEKVFVIGGATIYAALLDHCDSIYLTRVWTQVAGDTQVTLDLSPFACTHIERHPQTATDSLPTEFQIWTRKAGTWSTRISELDVQK